jgi:hypothetical protein
MRRLMLLFSLCFSIQSLAASQLSDLTFKQIKHKYLNQLVIIRGPLISTKGKSGLLHWNTVRQIGDRYQENMSNPLPAKYQQNTAKVIAVQLHLVHGKTKQIAAKVNALGEKRYQMMLE